MRHRAVAGQAAVRVVAQGHPRDMPPRRRSARRGCRRRSCVVRSSKKDESRSRPQPWKRSSRTKSIPPFQKRPPPRGCSASQGTRAVVPGQELIQPGHRGQDLLEPLRRLDRQLPRQRQQVLVPAPQRQGRREAAEVRRPQQDEVPHDPDGASAGPNSCRARRATSAPCEWATRWTGAAPPPKPAAAPPAAARRSPGPSANRRGRSRSRIGGPPAPGAGGRTGSAGVRSGRCGRGGRGRPPCRRRGPAAGRRAGWRPGPSGRPRSARGPRHPRRSGRWPGTPARSRRRRCWRTARGRRRRAGRRGPGRRARPSPPAARGGGRACRGSSGRRRTARRPRPRGPRGSIGAGTPRRAGALAPGQEPKAARPGLAQRRRRWGPEALPIFVAMAEGHGSTRSRKRFRFASFRRGSPCFCDRDRPRGAAPTTTPPNSIATSGVSCGVFPPRSRGFLRQLEPAAALPLQWGERRPRPGGAP